LNDLFFLSCSHPLNKIELYRFNKNTSKIEYINNITFSLEYNGISFNSKFKDIVIFTVWGLKMFGLAKINYETFQITSILNKTDNYK
jgi:hypothetical protein